MGHVPGHALVPLSVCPWSLESPSSHHRVGPGECGCSWSHPPVLNSVSVKRNLRGLDFSDIIANHPWSAFALRQLKFPRCFRQWILRAPLASYSCPRLRGTARWLVNASFLLHRKLWQLTRIWLYFSLAWRSAVSSSSMSCWHFSFIRLKKGRIKRLMGA